MRTTIFLNTGRPPKKEKEKKRTAPQLEFSISYRKKNADKYLSNEKELVLK